MINKSLSCLQTTPYDNKVWHEKKNVFPFSVFLNKNVKHM